MATLVRKAKQERKARLVRKAPLGALAALGCKEQPAPEQLGCKEPLALALLAQPEQLGQQAGKEPRA